AKRKKGKNRKKEVLGSATFGSAEDFVDPKRQVDSASVQAVSSGSTVLANVPFVWRSLARNGSCAKKQTNLANVPIGPGRAAVPFKFGQSNPFALPKVVASTSVVGAGGSYSSGTVPSGAHLLKV
ncbi:hypothetical protein AVEN_220670-1, partial [Araneus ventricosus]